MYTTLTVSIDMLAQYSRLPRKSCIATALQQSNANRGCGGAGTLRPQGRQADTAGEQAAQTASPAGTAWQAPPLVFHGADDVDTPSTPTKVKQLLKKGVVKFKEVSLLAYTAA